MLRAVALYASPLIVGGADDKEEKLGTVIGIDLGTFLLVWPFF